MLEAFGFLCYTEGKGGDTEVHRERDARDLMSWGMMEGEILQGKKTLIESYFIFIIINRNLSKSF